MTSYTKPVSLKFLQSLYEITLGLHLGILDFIMVMIILWKSEILVSVLIVFLK